MYFDKTPLKGAVVVHLEKILDSRGFFARAYCRNELKKIGIHKPIAQINTSFSNKRGTLRGLHYQARPHGEIKMMRCIRGVIFDVIIDLRPESDTYCKWYGLELREDSSTMLVIPEGFAHGYQTLVDNTEVLYPVTEFYSPGHEQGIRWDDPLFNIDWPVPQPILSYKDRSFPDYIK